MNKIKKFFKELLKPNKTFEEWAKEHNIDLKTRNIEENKQAKTCCFTGHRQIKISERELRSKLIDLISKAMDNGYKYFICGGAIGFDMIAAEQVIFLKSAYKDIKLELAIPCQEQDKFYSQIQKHRYADILKNADEIHKRDLPYDRTCMMLRNRYMVDNSSLVIAYFDSSTGGTKSTIDYANKVGVEILYI